MNVTASRLLSALITTMKNLGVIVGFLTLDVILVSLAEKIGFEDDNGLVSGWIAAILGISMAFTLVYLLPAASPLKQRVSVAVSSSYLSVVGLTPLREEHKGSLWWADLLELQSPFNEDTVRAAYKTQVKRWHPDLYAFGNPKFVQIAHARMISLNDARDIALSHLGEVAGAFAA